MVRDADVCPMSEEHPHTLDITAAGGKMERRVARTRLAVDIAALAQEEVEHLVIATGHCLVQWRVPKGISLPEFLVERVVVHAAYNLLHLLEVAVLAELVQARHEVRHSEAGAGTASVE